MSRTDTALHSSGIPQAIVWNTGHSRKKPSHPAFREKGRIEIYLSILDIPRISICVLSSTTDSLSHTTSPTAPLTFQHGQRSSTLLPGSQQCLVRLSSILNGVLQLRLILMWEWCSTIAQPYSFVKELGQGAYGCVISARHEATGEMCAVKKVHLDTSQDRLLLHLMPITLSLVLRRSRTSSARRSWQRGV